ncbi:protein TALPID3 isoform X2 [Astyanax mexicanus]|uniref:protein TALPID3 isoform X2 n=1 Tax=Astyanax mexicanus TaxID=7994 RepID=UPI0020CAE34E|nr:protein TALPID3 isoform X2 [Astyanax mexicanus]
MDYGSSVLHNIHLNDSTSSADAADVLIRSTKVAPELNRKKVASEGELSNNCNVNIFVRRLSDSTHSSCLEQTFTNELMEQVVPPVRPVNMPSAIRGCIEEEDHTSPNPPARKNYVPRAGKVMLKPSVIQRKWQKQEQDVHISRYSADGRGAVAAALKQRSHGAPQRREVKVQFLDSGSLHSSEFRGPEVQPSPAFPSGDVGGASTVAAITAAAIAATAPLIKAQSDMEARMAQVASELRRLQESEGRTDRSAESRATSDAGRVTQLEVQLTALTQQRLQHLERIQGQQLELQNRLLGSALTAVTAGTIPPSQSTHHSNSGETHSDSVQRALNSHKCAAEDSSTVVQDQSRETRAGREKSPLETPAPRKVIPRPTHWNPALQDSQQGSSKGRKATHKSHGNGRLLEQIPNNQRSPTRYPAHTVGVRGVAIATVDSQPEQSRENQPEAFIFSTGRPRPEESADALTKPSSKQHIQAGLKDVNPLTDRAPESSTSAVQQAAAMLQDLSRIKNEMRSLLRTADAFPVKSAEASRSSRSSRHALPSTTPPPPPVPPVSMQGDTVTSGAARAHPTVLQNSQPPASMFEDAGLVLRQVRHSRKVLEENLQAVLRAKDGEALHTQLEALSNNRDASEELRIKKTVDAWINTLSKDIQNELVHPGSAAQSKGVERISGAAAGSTVQRDQSSRSRNTPGTGRGSVKIGRGGKRATAVAAAATATEVARRRQQGRAEAVSTQPSNQHLSSSLRNSAEEHPQASVVPQSEDDEAYLAKIYGKALYEGHRRTLKKGPYLRFSSPSPKSKGHRPKVIESVKGVKMKSSKTQTSMSGAQDPSSLLQPAVPGTQYLFSPSGPVQQQQQQPGCSVPGFLIPMAIPLGKPKVDGQAPLPSRVIISDKPATVITSFTPAVTPTVVPSVRKPNTVLLEVQSEQRRPTPQLQIQVQPSVNIESVTAPSPDLSPPLHIAPPDIQAGADTRSIGEEDEEEDDDDDNGFPGTKFLAVADILEPEVDEEAPEEAPIELNGLPSPPAALYHGPAFPLEPRQTGPLTEPILSTIQQRETLENRLVDWVEQQLMARMISGMFPQPAQTDPANQSEPDDSVTSDIVETAGGGGLQLFVDAGVPVDSELIRQYVNEVLAEIITLMLGQREGPREPAAPASIRDTLPRQKTPVPTPVPTPEPSVRGSPPVLREALSPISTPDLSEQPSPVQSRRDSQPEQPQPTSPEPAKTPVGTPLSSPRRIATPSPPSELAGPHNLPWGNSELPLKEEEPHSEEEENQPKPLNVLSVAREEDEEAVLPPSSPVLSKPLSPPVSAVKEAPPAPPESPSVEESSSQVSPSLTETETETAARHISEGELLLSTGQMAAVRALEEEGFNVPNLMTSFNSSLHGVQDMDYDPPSEGQVIRRPVVSAHHDPILSLLAKMEQGPVSQAQQRERYWDEESSGEVSEGQRPPLTTAQEKVVTGHSLILQQPTQSTQPTAEQSPHTTLTSPGQLPVQHTGPGNGAAGEDSGLSINFRPSETHAETPQALQSFTASSPQPGDSTHKQAAEAPQTHHRPAPILVKQYQHEDESDLLAQRRSSNDTDAFFEDMAKGAELTPHAGGGVGLMSVRLPSVQKDDVSPDVSTIEGDSDSANDVF